MTFTATATRDHVARAHTGQTCEATFYRTDETGTDLYEVTFADGEIILATAADLNA